MRSCKKSAQTFDSCVAFNPGRDLESPKDPIKSPLVPVAQGLQIQRARGFMNMNSTSKLRIAALLSSAFFMAACGAQPQRQVTGATGAGITSSDPVGGGGTTPTDTSGNTNPPLAFSFSLNGRDTSGTVIPAWKSAAISTDNLLKIKITPGAAGGLNVPGSGYVANYGCISYDVKVLDQMITTSTLAVNGGSSACPGAPTSQILDFTSRLTPGHGALQVQVSNPRYDFYCVSCYTFPWFFNAYQYGCNMYCPLRPLYKNHTAAGSIKVQVDGTYLD